MRRESIRRRAADESSRCDRADASGARNTLRIRRLFRHVSARNSQYVDKQDSEGRSGTGSLTVLAGVANTLRNLPVAQSSPAGLVLTPLGDRSSPSGPSTLSTAFEYSPATGTPDLQVGSVG